MVGSAGKKGIALGKIRVLLVLLAFVKFYCGGGGWGQSGVFG